MPTPSPSADRNLIFGLLALQMDFVTREQLLDALHAWMLHKSTPLGQILRERGVLNERRAGLLAGMVEEHVAQHGGDAQASLAALRVEPVVRRDFARLDDADVQASLSSLAADEDRSLGAPVTSAPAQFTPPNVRFRRLRDHAKGGLGEVFVALDGELNREVALKEIQDRFADQSNSRARFLREAEITGNLEHPGVVPVYGLGAYPNGRPFYAMRFIRGESMKEAIARFHAADEQPCRDPSERSLALRDLLGQFVAVCNAVGYAHARGVIHRDLKPANVMLGEYGETLVVDWGLARLLAFSDSEQTTAERPISSGSGSGPAATEMGQVVGTPAYMPPEQAGGMLDRIGISSDVFALGATLYALLTGQAPYHGDDVIGQACRAEVVPARQLERSVPAALEAVCGKAMAKRPEDRYASARALAEEVQRWLADEPVRAYREPLADRVRRWGRRNRSVVSAGVVLLVAGVLGLSLGLWAVERESAKSRAALGRALTAEEEAKAALGRAQTAEEEAKANLVQAKSSEEKAKGAARSAAEEKEKAEKAEAATLADYRASTDDAIEQLIGSKPVLGAQEKTYLEKTLKRWQMLAARTGDDKRSRAIRAEGQFRVALLRAKLGQSEEAAAGYQEALAIWQKLADEFPAVPKYRQELAASHNNLGLLLAEQNQLDKAAEHYRKALTIQKKLADEFPAVTEYHQNLDNSHNNLGSLLKAQNQPEQAAEQYRKALAIQHKLADEFPAVPKYRKDLAGSHNNLGMVLSDQNQPDKAAEQYRKALDIYQKLADEFPAVPAYRKDLAGSRTNLGNLLSDQNQPDKAAEQYRKALDIYQKLAGDFPAVPTYRHELASSHNNLGLLLAEQSQPEQAAEQYRMALDIRQKLADQFPAVPAYRKDLAGSHYNLGLLLAVRNKPDRAEEQYREALGIQQKLVGEFPAVPEYQVALGGSCCNFGALLRDGGKPAESLTWFDRAIRALTPVQQQNRRAVTPRQFLRNSHWGRARAYHQLEKYEEAVKDWNRAIELSPVRQQPLFRAKRAGSRVRMGRVASAVAEVTALMTLANLPADHCYDFACIYAVASGKSADKKQEYADRAMELLHQAVRGGYKNAAHLAKDGDLDVLRQRDDFKKLLASLAKPKEKGPIGVPEKK